jgi:hypothetical protein
MLTCPVCGHEVSPTDNFCPNCGASLAKLQGETTKSIALVEESLAIEDLGAEDVQALEALPEGYGMLLQLRAGRVGERYLLKEDVTTAGRSTKSDIFLDDVTVSRRHARFSRHDGQIWIRDEGSLNGTYVNHVNIDSEVPLHTGDVVQIGKFRMVFFEAA